MHDFRKEMEALDEGRLRLELLDRERLRFGRKRRREQRMSNVLKAIFGFIILMALLTAIANAQPDDVLPMPQTQEEVMATAMLNPVVRIETNRGTGSGTVVKVDGEYSYILTNFHVAETSMALMQRDGYSVQLLGPIKVTFNIHTRGVIATETVEGSIYSFAEEWDLALIRVRYNKVPAVTMVDPASLRVFERVYVSGYPLGVPTQYPSMGRISTLELMSGGLPYIGVDAPLISGNSGGALFVERDGKYLFVGVPSMLVTVKSGPSEIPVYHMNMSIPIKRVRMFMRTSGIL